MTRLLTLLLLLAVSSAAQQPTNIQHADSTPHGCTINGQYYALCISGDFSSPPAGSICTLKLRSDGTWTDEHCVAPPPPALGGTLTLTYDEVELLASLLNQLHIPDDTPAMRDLAGKIEKLIGGPKPK